MTKARVNADNASADIQGVTAGTGLSGGGTSGTVTLTNDMATAIDAKGDIVVGTGADAYDNLAVGSNGDTLVADSAATTGLRWQSAYNGNQVINGGMDYWQRGTSFANVHAYTADRWKTDGATAVAVQTLSQLALSPNEISGFDGAYAARLNVTNVNGATKIQLQTRIEDVRTFAGRTVTLSFWAKADSSRTLSAMLSQQFGSGGSSGVDTASQNASLTTSWQRFSLTYSLPSISGKTIGTGNFLLIDFSFPLATFTIDITGVQLELGSVATTFKRAGGTLQGELAACQRYYEKSYDLGKAADSADVAEGIPQFTGVNANNAFGTCQFKVAKRSAPTVNIYAGAGGSGAGSIRNNTGAAVITGVSAGSINQTGFANLFKSGAFTVGSIYGLQFTAESEL